MKNLIILLMFTELLIIGCTPKNPSFSKLSNHDLRGIWCSDNELNYCYQIIVNKKGKIKVGSFPKDEIYEIDGDISIPAINKFFPADLKFIDGENQFLINVGNKIDTAIIRKENKSLYINDSKYEVFDF